jgi:hypothetical protein
MKRRRFMKKTATKPSKVEASAAGFGKKGLCYNKT